MKVIRHINSGGFGIVEEVDDQGTRSARKELELRAHAALGHTDELNRLLDLGRSLPAQPNMSLAVMMLREAEELRAHGYQPASDSLAQRALAWLATRSPLDQSTVESRETRVSLLSLLRRYSEARAILEPLAREHPDQLNYLGGLGTLAARRHDAAEAQHIAGTLEKRDGPYVFGRQTFWRARIAAILGERERAVTLLREAMSQGVRFDWLLHINPDFEMLRGYAPFEALMHPVE